MGVAPRETDYKSTPGGLSRLVSLSILPPGSTSAPSTYQELNPRAYRHLQSGSQAGAFSALKGLRSLDVRGTVGSF